VGNTILPAHLIHHFITTETELGFEGAFWVVHRGMDYLVYDDDDDDDDRGEGRGE